MITIQIILIFYTTLPLMCVVSITVLGLLYSFFISDTGDDAMIFIVIAGIITGFFITK